MVHHSIEGAFAHVLPALPSGILNACTMHTYKALALLAEAIFRFMTKMGKLQNPLAQKLPAIVDALHPVPIQRQ
jgi:hypothetical protein